MHKWKVAVALTVSIGLCCAAVAQVAATKNAPPSVPSVSGTSGQRIDTPSQAKTPTTQDQSQNQPSANGVMQDRHSGTPADRRISNLAEPGVPVVSDRDAACQNAVQITCDSVTVVTMSLPYVEYGFMRPSCVPSGAAYGNGQWFYFDITGSPTGVKIDTCSPAAALPQIPDSVVTLYRVDGTPACDNLVEIACSNDTAPGKEGICLDSEDGPERSGLGSQFIYGLLEPDRYYIQVGIIGWHADTDYSLAMGDYNLSVDCDPTYISCVVDSEPGDYIENEYISCLQMQDFINGGCGASAEHELFTEIECNTTIYGNMAFVREVADEDWYLITLSESSNVTLTMVAAEFAADVELYAAAPCDELGLPLAVGTYGVECGAQVEIGPVTAPAGAYYVVVKPTEDTYYLECWKQYRLTVSTSPCNPAEGACCTGDPPAASTMTKEDCDLAGGTWYGAGVDPTSITCWTCSGEDEDESVCQDGYLDSTNSGCAWSDTQPALSPIADGDIICGTSGTYLNSSTHPTDNVRDNDWYRLLIGGSGSAPVGTIEKVTAKVLAEFDIEVILVRLPNPSNPCPTFEFAAQKVIPAGVEDEVSQCFIKKMQYAPYRDMWIIVRPAARGTSVDIPCGLNYTLEVECTECTETGACCFDNGCAENTSAADCFAEDGEFFGPGSTCADACCPCSPTDTPEGESQCGYQYRTGHYDPINGGCMTAGGGDPYTGDATYLPISSGEHYCGTVGTYCPGDGYCYADYDYYAIEVTEQADLTMNCYLQGATAFVPMFSTLPNFPNCTGSSNRWVPGWPFPDCEWGSYTIEDAMPGWYLVGVKVNFDYEYDRDTCYRYEFYVTVGEPTAACCTDSLCEILTEQECADQEGVWLEGQDCDPNPCCTVECDVSEGEPNCGNPVDTVNGGCTTNPPLFSDLLEIDGSVCGTTAMWETIDGRSRDTDWYTFNYTGGDLKFCIESEFPSDLLILRDPNEPCGYMVGWEKVLTGDCTSGCIWLSDQNPDLIPGEYYLVVMPDPNAIEFVDCPSSPSDPSYLATVFQGAFGACCLGDPNAPYCQAMLEPECQLQGGTFTAGVDCDPNPCCDLECEDSSVLENEANCGMPTDTVNPGCNPLPNDPAGPFIELAWTPGDPNTIATICGTTGVDSVTYSPALRDTDWYTYNHTGGNLVWWIGSEFDGTFFVYGPATEPNDPCSSESGFRLPLIADCGAGSLFTYTDPNDTPAGLYTMIVVPSFGWDITCGSKYELAVTSGEKGACCVMDPDLGQKVCVETWEHLCVGLFEGQWMGSPTCDGVVCDDFVPCAGDMDCSGKVDFDDIDPFVAALGCQGGDPSCWPPPAMPYIPAGCPWINGDCNDDDAVNFDDIDPFVARFGADCP